jgi:hypothetical protein
MSTETDNRTRLHCHFRRVVLSNAHGTQYLDPAHARALAREMLAFAKAIDAGRYPGARVVTDGRAVSESTGKRARVFV